MPGGDGLIITIAGAWAGLLIFYRVFSRPPGNGYPVGIEWGFFLAFIAAGALAYAGLADRAPPNARSRRAPPRRAREPPAARGSPRPRHRRRGARVTGARRARRSDARAETEQLSLEDPPPRPRYPPPPPPALGPRRRGRRRAYHPRMMRRAHEPQAPSPTSPRASGRPATCRPSRPRWSSPATRLVSPCSSRAPPASARPSSPRRWRAISDRELVRLQCYEGLDEAKALYEWNYRKQLLRIQAEAGDTGWEAVQEDIFGEEFLLARPLMTAIASEDPVVLLIDEIDKTDQEFEAMLLEVLSDFQISIPELGRVEARTHPVVLLTSNNTRELTEALKRRCLYLWLDYPDLEHELEIVRMHSPELRDRRAQTGRGHRHGARSRPEEAAEHRRVDRLGTGAAAARRQDIDARFRQTMRVIVKHRTDLDTVAERVGVKLRSARRCG